MFPEGHASNVTAFLPPSAADACTWPLFSVTSPCSGWKWIPPLRLLVSNKKRGVQPAGLV
ncbi:hypothetical protein FDB76_19660 (plasmid) [Acinetobacter baumannii]|nr:hypothetical protein FDB76_19660 [Acinetobacter baumannii]